MKVIKLNRRFKVHKERGHEVAVRFNGFGSKASELEKVCRDRLGTNIWNLESTWYGWVGASRDGGARPYFVSFRRESDLTFVLLGMES